MFFGWAKIVGIEVSAHKKIKKHPPNTAYFNRVAKIGLPLCRQYVLLPTFS